LWFYKKVHRGWQCALLELPPAAAARVLALEALDLAPHAAALTAAQQRTLLDAYAALARDRPRRLAAARECQIPKYHPPKK
jgi:hypothetical protein